MKPICVPCKRFFRPKKNGYYFLEGMPKWPNRPKPGLAEPEKWEPYKLWVGDIWECQGCGATIIAGTPHSPIAEHYQLNFKDQVAYYGAEFQVNDC